MQADYDAIIVGGGPAGSTCALYAAQNNVNVLLLDKKAFPRDKICGDAISGKSVIYLRELGLLPKVDQAPGVKVFGVIFSSPNGKQTYIKFSPSYADRLSYGYVCRREVFDNILFQAAKERVEVRERFTVDRILMEGDQVVGVAGREANGRRREFTAKVVVGADGYQSVLLRQMKLYQIDPRHWVIATRAYYRGVKGLTDAIEIHFVKDVLPGYFWIFPLENGLANVGLGMLHGKIKKNGISLREAHIAATRNPYFRERFANAELIGGIRGWNLPLGSKKRPVHGNGFLLIGDAAGLIDPFSGEGIGNAMASAKLAAEVLADVCPGHDFSAHTLQIYADRLWAMLWPELSVSYKLQLVGRIRPLVNLVIDRAAKYQEVRDWIAAMMIGIAPRSDLTSPKTYLRLLFQPG